MKYDYSKLKGLVVEKYGTIGNFAQSFGESRQNVSCKMNDKVEWSREDMIKICGMLGQPTSMIPALFYTLKVDK